MVVGYRVCLSNRPDEPKLSTTGPRLGPMSRGSYDISWNAAGNPFKHGEPEFRTWSVDAACLPRRKKDPMKSFDSSDAAGRGRALTEVRALDVDDHVRRAYSEPPKALRTRAEVQLAMQAFGVYADVDSFCTKGKVNAEQLSPTRKMIGRTAMEFTDITALLKRKTFHDAAPPGSSLSPRIAAQATESVDIDAHFGRSRCLSCDPTAQELRSAPWSRASFDEAIGASPAATRRHFFEKILAAEKYAALVGRPHIRRSKEEVAEAVAGTEEVLRLQEMESGWLRNGSNRETRVQESVKPRMVRRSSLKKLKRASTCDTVSTTASSLHHLPSFRSVPDDMSEDWCSLSEIDEEEYNKDYCNSRVDAEVATPPLEQEPDDEVPLGLRRVLASFSEGDVSSLLENQGPAVDKLCTSLKGVPRGQLKTSKVLVKNRVVNAKNAGQPKSTFDVSAMLNQSGLSDEGKSKLRKNVESMLKKTYCLP